MGKTLLSLWGLKKPPNTSPTDENNVENASSVINGHIVPEAALEEEITTLGKHADVPELASDQMLVETHSSDRAIIDGDNQCIVLLKYKATPPPPKYLFANSLGKRQSSFCAPAAKVAKPQETAVINETTLDAVVPTRPRRELIVSLKCPNEKLQAVQAKRHSFFAQRNIATPTKVSSSMVLKPLVKPKPILPCFPQVHAIPPRSVALWRLPRRSRLGVHASSAQFTTADSLKPLPSLTQTLQQKPKLLKTSHSEFEEMTRNDKNRTGKIHPYIRAAIESCSVETSFDKNQTETQLWVDKYAPVTARTCLHYKEANLVKTWVKKRAIELKSTSWKSVRDSRLQTRVESELDDFVVPDQPVDSVPAVMIICGRPGQGKTASVFAIAKELESFVIESNNSDKRTGKSLSDLVDGIGQSKAVHSTSSQKSGKDCIVLIEEIDKLFEAESQSYLTALDKLIYSCRRPVILTCESTEKLPVNLLDKRIAQICRFETTNARNVSDIAWRIAVDEGHILDRAVVDKIALSFLGDLRKTVNYLQFWCQKTIGGRKSGIDWMITPEERQVVDRVISVNTPVELPPAKETLQNVPSLLSDAAGISDALSLFDRSFAVQYAEEKDSLNGVPFTVDLEEDHQDTHTWSESLEALNYFKKVSKRSPDNMHAVIPVYDEWNTDVTLELAPYYRHFARCDRWRHNKLTAARKENSRSSRRSWASIGIDSREFVPDWHAVLKEFVDSPEFDVGEDVMTVPLDKFSSQDISKAGSFDTE